MKPAIISVVKDEVDCIREMIEYNSRHTNVFFIMDNASTDGTYEAIKDLKSKYTIFLYRDNIIDHFQSFKMTRLANLAYQHGLQYVLPLDGDELFVSEKSIDEHCEILTRPGIALIDWKLFHPTEKDDQSIENPFKRITYTSGTQKTLSKSLIRWKPGMRIWQGNHGIDNSGQYMETRLQDSFVANFPWRSREHTKKKIINNGVSHKNIEHNADRIKASYRGWLAGGEAFIDDFWEKNVAKSEELTRCVIV